MSTANFTPGTGVEGTFTPDKLHAGDHPIRTVGVVVTGGNYTRGSALGIITASEKATLSASASTDGSEEIVGLLGEDVDASGGDVNSFMYIAGDYNSNAVTLGTGHTLSLALRLKLAARGIYLTDAVPA